MVEVPVKQIEPEIKHVLPLAIGDTIFTLLAIVALYFERVDIAIASVIVLLSLFAMFKLVLHILLSYTMSITKDVISIKRNGKDFLSDTWEDIVHDGHVILVKGLPIKVIPYDTNQPHTDQYDKNIIDQLFEHVKKSKKISTEEIEKRQKRDLVNMKMLYIAIFALVVLFCGYVIYVF